MIFGHKRHTTVYHAFEERAEKNAFGSCGSFFTCVACLVLVCKETAVLCRWASKTGKFGVKQFSKGLMQNHKIN